MYIQWLLFQYSGYYFSTVATISVKWLLFQYSGYYFSTVTTISVQWLLFQYSGYYFSTVATISVQWLLFQYSGYYFSTVVHFMSFEYTVLNQSCGLKKSCFHNELFVFFQSELLQLAMYVCLCYAPPSFSILN